MMLISIITLMLISSETCLFRSSINQSNWMHVLTGFCLNENLDLHTCFSQQESTKDTAPSLKVGVF